MRNTLGCMARKRTLSSKETAEALGSTVRTVRRYTRKGCPYERHSKGNRFNLEEVREWLEASRLTGKPGRPQSEEGEDRANSKARLDAAKAAKAELERASLRRELIPREDVVALYTALTLGIRETVTTTARAQEPDRREFALEFGRAILEDIHPMARRLVDEHLPPPALEEDEDDLAAGGHA